MRKIISRVLIIAGVLILCVPAYNDWQSDRRTEAILAGMSQTEMDMKRLQNGITEAVPDFNGRVIVSDKIDLAMPVVDGATFENMIDSVATIRHTGVEEGKNLSIAGHRYIRHGRHFNRIDELEQDDVITLWDNGNRYDFAISNKLVVEPTEIGVLDDTGDTEITLITCHPPGISSHRLVVKGKLLEDKINAK